MKIEKKKRIVLGFTYTKPPIPNWVLKKICQLLEIKKFRTNKEKRQWKITQ